MTDLDTLDLILEMAENGHINNLSEWYRRNLISAARKELDAKLLDNYACGIVDTRDQLLYDNSRADMVSWCRRMLGGIKLVVSDLRAEACKLRDSKRPRD